jgi:hypothetical protein
MVIKIEGRSCLAVTPDGDFREVPLPKGVVTRLGQQITLDQKKKRLPYLRLFMAAASFLIIVLAGQLYLGHAPQAVAYLTIDINPSIELAVSSDGKVVSSKSLNSDGERILSEIRLKGFDLDKAVGIIVSQAIADNYLTKADDNVILATLTVNEDSDPLVDLEFVYRAIKSSMDSGGVVSEVIIDTVKPEMRQEAEESGISTGRLLLQKKTAEKSLPVSGSDVSTMSLSKFEKEKEVTIIELLGEGTDNVQVYNLDKGEGAGIVKQGIYAERRNDNIKIKSKPVRDKGVEINNTNKGANNNTNNKTNNNTNNNIDNDNENNKNQDVNDSKDSVNRGTAKRDSSKRL